VDLLLEAGMEQIREKSIRQTEYLIDLWETYLQPLGFALRSPRAAQRRGSHVALSHPQALGISLALKEQRNVLLDFRHPDNLRLSVAPLYTPYEAIYEAVQRIRKVVTEGLYEAYAGETPAVT
jgi:kynureninase